MSQRLDTIFADGLRKFRFEPLDLVICCFVCMLAATKARNQAEDEALKPPA